MDRYGDCGIGSCLYIRHRWRCNNIRKYKNFATLSLSTSSLRPHFLTSPQPMSLLLLAIFYLPTPPLISHSPPPVFTYPRSPPHGTIPFPSTLLIQSSLDKSLVHKTIDPPFQPLHHPSLPPKNRKSVSDTVITSPHFPANPIVLPYSNRAGGYVWGMNGKGVGDGKERGGG